MSVIDCHQHFWTFGKRAHKFPPAVGTRLDRDYTPEILRPQLKKAGVDGTILVQVLNEVDETYEFLDMQREIDFVAGVVGWVPLTDPAVSARALESMKPRGKLVGIRPLIAYEPDPNWLLQPSVRESLGLLAKAGLVFRSDPGERPSVRSGADGDPRDSGIEGRAQSSGQSAGAGKRLGAVGDLHRARGRTTKHVDQALGRAGASGQMEMVDQGNSPLCRPRARSVRARPGDGRKQLAGGGARRNLCRSLARPQRIDRASEAYGTRCMLGGSAQR